MTIQEAIKLNFPISSERPIEYLDTYLHYQYQYDNLCQWTRDGDGNVRYISYYNETN